MCVWTFVSTVKPESSRILYKLSFKESPTVGNFCRFNLYNPNTCLFQAQKYEVYNSWSKGGSNLNRFHCIREIVPRVKVFWWHVWFNFRNVFVDVCLYIYNMFNLMLNVSLLYGSLLTYNYICLCMDDVYLIVNVYSISTIKYFDHVYNF